MKCKICVPIHDLRHKNCRSILWHAARHTVLKNRDACQFAALYMSHFFWQTAILSIIQTSIKKQLHE